MNFVAACRTLHNVCELKKREFFEDWLQNIDIGVAEKHTIPRKLSSFWAGLSNTGGNQEFH